MGEVLEYNGMTKLPESWWENFGPTPSAHKSGVPGICHDITGTDGMGYAPNVDKNSDVWLFNDQLCRSIWLSYQEEVDVHGIKTYQYSPDPSVFSMSNPDNYCYCPKVSQCAKPTQENTDQCTSIPINILHSSRSGKSEYLPAGLGGRGGRHRG